MAVRPTVFSDISNNPVPDDQHVRIIIQEHPALNGSQVQIDVSLDEASKLTSDNSDMVIFQIFEPNKPPRRVVLNGTDLAKLYKGVDFADVIQRAEPVPQRAEAAARSVATRGRPKGTTKAPKAQGSGINYRDMENIGLEHRGRVTEEEAQLVRENLDKANANRAREGQAPIDPTNEKFAKRYGMTPAA